MATHEDTWRKLHPRPELDDPYYWLNARPKYKEEENGEGSPKGECVPVPKSRGQ